MEIVNCILFVFSFEFVFFSLYVFVFVSENQVVKELSFETISTILSVHQFLERVNSERAETLQLGRKIQIFCKKKKEMKKMLDFATLGSCKI